MKTANNRLMHISIASYDGPFLTQINWAAGARCYGQMMDSLEALQKFIDRLLLRSHLGPAEVDAIARLPARIVEVGRGRDLVRHGDRLDSALLVLDGLAGRYEPQPYGDRQITAFHIPGDMCDLHSVPIQVASWSVEALSDVRLARIGHAPLLALSRDYPQIALAFWRDTAVDGAIFAKWMCNLGRKDARTRLAHLLCEIGVRMERARLGSRRSFGLLATQGQFAEALGMTSVHLNRVLQALRRDGLVEWKTGRVTVSDWPALARAGDFDPAYLQDEVMALDQAVTGAR